MSTLLRIFLFLFSVNITIYTPIPLCAENEAETEEYEDDSEEYGEEEYEEEYVEEEQTPEEETQVKEAIPATGYPITQTIAPEEIIPTQKTVEPVPPVTSTPQEEPKQIAPAKQEALSTEQPTTAPIEEPGFRIPEQTTVVANWLSDEEIKNIKIALTPTNPNYGGIIAGKTHDSKTIIDKKTGKYYITKAYYGMLKEQIRKGIKRSSYRDGYSTRKELDVKQAVRAYPKLIMTKNLLKTTWEAFQKVSPQRSWPKWFENINDDLNIELMFDYLAGFDEKGLKRIFTEWLGITSRVKMTSALRRIKLYKKSAVYRGSDTGKSQAPQLKRR